MTTTGVSPSFTPIDLSKLPPPPVVEPLDFEAIRADLLADFIARYPEFSAVVESEPVLKLFEAWAYRELLLRQRINDAARSVMIATAGGADLEHLAALFGVERLTGEDDHALRYRSQLAIESFSVAGPAGAYMFHGLSASDAIKDLDVTSPAP